MLKSVTRTYRCTDEASEGASVIDAATAADALSEYIANALANPASYNQGEDGVATWCFAYARPEFYDGANDEATATIDFGLCPC